MSKKIYDIWDASWYKINLINEIKTIQEDELIVLLPQEYSLGDVTPTDYQIIDEELSLHNKKLKIYLGAEFERNFYRSFKNITLHYWDSIDWFIRAFDFHTGRSSGFDEIQFCEILKDTIPTKHFTTMVYLKSGREWRIYVVNELHKKNLHNDGHYSFIVEKNFYHYVKTNRPLNDIWIYETPSNETGLKMFKMDSWDLSDRKIESVNSFLDCCEERIEQICCPIKYFDCSFYIGIETLYDFFFVTEKTTRALETKKPFFVFSCVYFHKKLSENYGFRLYHELIDYSFDSIKNSTERFDAQINELVKIKSKYSPEEIYHLTKDNVDYNYNILKGMRKKKNVPHIPDEFYNVKINKEYKKFYE